MSSELNKPSRSASRLRLRMPKEKSEDDDDDDEKPIETKELSSPSKEDSLADFKSPKLNTKVYQNDSIKILKDSSVKKIKKAAKKPGKSKISGDSRKMGKSSNEQSIESLFFRAQSEKSNFICPLCLKAFNDSNNQSIHTKNCAAKNNVSTRKLLAAVELQEKQKEERRAIGLPAGPIATIPKKRSANPTRRFPQNDADIELALALSLSLREVEKIEEFEEAVAVAAGSNEKILEMSSSQRKSTLQSFGFSSNKPVGEAFNVNSHKKKRRKLLGPTVLQSRTQETRERILTERISEILVGSQSITQQNSEENRNLSEKSRKFAGVENKELIKWYKKSGNLWSRSQGNCGDEDYYVGELSKFIIPGFGKNRIDEDDGNEEDIVELKEEMEEIKIKEVEKKEKIKDLEKKGKIKDVEKKEKIQKIEKKEKIEEIEIKEDNEEMEIEENAIVLQKTSQTSQKSEEPKKISNFDDSLKISWSRMIDNSHLSDLRIFVKNDGFIHAHNLVIWTRCQLLTNDYKISDYQNGEDHYHKFQMTKYEVHWPNIDRSAAIIFLNYVYCSDVSADLLRDRKIRDQVRSLAEKYGMIDLLECLRDLRDSDEESMNEKIENYEKISDSRDFEREIDESLNNELENHEKNDENHLKVEEINNRSSNYSPDLFDDSEKFESLKETSIVSLSSEIDEEKEIEPSIVSKKTEIDVCDVDEENLDDDHRHEENLDDDDLDEEKNASNTPKIGEIVAKKAKSNLSIFIDKINRQQARGILESDTDGDTPLKDCEIYRKNPFKIRGSADDSLYSWKKNKIDKIDKTDKIGVSSDRPEVKKTPLTVLEEEIRARALKNQFSGANEDSLTVNSQESANSLEESMYTKYVKKKKKEENSINEYRDALKCLDDSEDDRSIGSIDQSNRSIDPGSVILSSTRNNFSEKCEENAEAAGSGDLFDSDFEISGSFGVSGEKRLHRDDNIVGEGPDLDPDASSTPKFDNDDGMQKNLGNFTQSKSKSQSKREKVGFREFSDSDDDHDDFDIYMYDQNVGRDDDCDDNHHNNREMQENLGNLTQSQSKSKREKGEFGEFYGSDSDFEISDPLEVPGRKKSAGNCGQDDDCDDNHRNDDEMQEILENFTQSQSKSKLKSKQEKVGFEGFPDSDSDFEISDPCEVPEDDKSNKNVDDDDDCHLNHHNNDEIQEIQENFENFTQSESKREKESFGKFGKFYNSDFEMSDPCEEVPEENKNGELNQNDDHYDDFDPNHHNHNHNHNHNDNESQENLLNFTQSKSERVIILSSSEDEHCTSSSTVRKRPHEENLSSWEIPEDPEEEISQCRSKSRSFTQKSVSPRLQERENSQINEKIDEISNNKNSNNKNGASDGKIHETSNNKNSNKNSNNKNGASDGKIQETSDKNSNKNENYIKKSESPLEKSPKKTFSSSKNPLKRRRVSSSFQISYNLTPPKDYDRMESPELNEEMNKYGLKPQKRHRAVQLLQHIYNELHPSVPADMEVFKGLSFADSENEEPPCKKKFSPEILEKSISDEDLDEEIKTQLNEDVNCHSQSSLEDIKEAFHKLLTSNKQIFNKILTYEPLPLELLYENLINQGFKGKINEVISFLDDQCITFQVQENNKNRRKKKKEKPLKKQDL